MLVRRSAWDVLRGYDESRWLYAEDLDLGWRLARAGWATRYVPRARVGHAVSASTTQVWGDERRKRWMHATYAWMMQSHGPGITRCVASINVAGAGARWLWRIPLARGSHVRWAAERDEFRRWTRLHTIGPRCGDLEPSGRPSLPLRESL